VIASGLALLFVDLMREASWTARDALYRAGVATWLLIGRCQSPPTTR
jgi:hypothetical protein